MLAYAAYSFLGVLLLTSGWTKLLDPRAFLRISQQYPLPFRISTGLLKICWTRGIPLLEMLTGLLLLSLQVKLTRIGLWIALAFLSAASAAIFVRALRGEKRFACGCGSDLTVTHSVRFLLWRNSLLLLMMLALAFLAPGQSLTPKTQAIPLSAAAGGIILTNKLFGAWRVARGSLQEWLAAG